MEFTTTGIVLNTENYRECREFYGTVLGLSVLYETGAGNDEITVFSMGGSYLMVEHGGMAYPTTKPIEMCPIKLRFNVPDVERAAQDLADKGIAVELLRHDWGTTAEFSDPDGNRCALRSDAGFCG